MHKALIKFGSPTSRALAWVVTLGGFGLLYLFLKGWLDEKEATVVGAVAAGLWAVWKIHVDAAHRDRDRRIEARRAVYLEIAKASAAPIGYLTNIANLAIPLAASVEKVNEAFSIMNKVHVVADEETLNVVLDSNEVFIEALFRLVRQRAEIESIQSERKKIFDQITNLGKQEQTVLDTLKTPLPDSDRKKLIEYLQEIQQSGAELMAKDAALIGPAAERQKKLWMDANRASLEHGVNAAKVNLRIRQELESPLSDNYVRAVQASCDRTHLKFKEFVAQISAEANQVKAVAPAKKPE